MTSSIRKPSLMDALLPVALLVALLALAVYYFGDSSSSGANQISLMFCAGIAIVIGLKKRSSMEGY